MGIRTSKCNHHTEQHRAILRPALLRRLERGHHRRRQHVHHEDAERHDCEHVLELCSVLFISEVSTEGQVATVQQKYSPLRLIAHREDKAGDDSGRQYELRQLIDILDSLRVQRRVLQRRGQHDKEQVKVALKIRVSFLSFPFTPPPPAFLPPLDRPETALTMLNHENIKLMILYTVSTNSMILRCRLCPERKICPTCAMA